MRNVLPLVIFIVAVAYLTPLYPVYAQTTDTQTPAPSVKRIVRPALNTATTPGNLKTVMVAQQAMENMENVRDKMASRSAELKAKLLKFKDKNKAKRVEMVNSQLAAVNSRRTSQMQQSLNRLSQIVTKLKTWVTEQETAGKDVTALKTAISSTETLWAEADAAVKDQADNDYTIVINSETTVKTDAQTARDSLHNDLKTVHDKLISVRQTLATALSTWEGGN